MILILFTKIKEQNKCQSLEILGNRTQLGG